MPASVSRGSAAAPVPAQDAAAAHLKPDEIGYLVLEGGGGKGFAYLGALQILESQGVLAALKGVAGTSAGAITALMLALRMGPEAIANELNTHDFNEFFDPPLDRQGRRLVPAPFEYFAREDDAVERLLVGLREAPGDLGQLLRIALEAPEPVTGLIQTILATNNAMTQEILEHAAVALEQHKLVPLAVLARGLNRYTAYFRRDMGLFSGKAARDYFDMLVRREAVRQSGSTKYATKRASPTFLEHKLVFKRDLLVCGANLSTGRTVLFSWKHTPHFPVADAVRISMGLPVIYKPYVICRQLAGWPECGTYIDGGLWNNLPFREIGALAGTAAGRGGRKASAAAAPAAGAARTLSQVVSGRSTLGLRLEITPPKPVLTGGQVVGKLATAGLAAGETQVIAELEPLTLVLDTDALELLDFRPPEKVQERVNKRSRRAMRDYFGLDKDPDDADVEDEARIADLRLRNACSC